uniref:Beta-1,4 N-acetylgalactosaminyltransferase n=1 Tax=Eptatretus burgeri TaxID=7764 RepID=A0A8C4QM81_EPTBU
MAIVGRLSMMRKSFVSVVIICLSGVLLMLMFWRRERAPISTVNLRRSWSAIYRFNSTMGGDHQQLADNDVTMVLPGNSCDCKQLPWSKSKFNPFHFWMTEKGSAKPHPLDENEGAWIRREHEYKQHLVRFSLPEHELMFAQANFPLSYPTQGLRVHPLGTILIPGLHLLASTKHSYKLSLSCQLGNLNRNRNVNVEAKGLGTNRLVLTSLNLQALNEQLKFITYTNKLYLPGVAERVKVEYEGQIAEFLILVQHPQLPRLYDPGTGNISELVTVVTKTFLRYDDLKKLIASIREFYPDIHIIIADDSEPWQPITGWRIEHYKMPFAKGWFAGRNLAISQVTTKYLVWVDDDFIFTKDTKLEKLLTVLEDNMLDMVGGAVREATGFSRTYRHKLTISLEKEDGYCLQRQGGYYHELAGFPGCVLTDGVINFFLGRTESIRNVGFDPRHKRVAHTEFFIDGVGHLRVGSCDYVIVDHASKLHLKWFYSNSQKEYVKFRYLSNVIDSHTPNAQQVLFFKNRLKCYNMGSP